MDKAQASEPAASAPHWAALDEEARAQYWATLALRHTQGLGARSWTRLLHLFGSAYAALEHLDQWGEAGVSAEKAAQVAAGSWRVTARGEWDRARLCHARIVLWHEEGYPELLRQLPDAPALLYCRGDMSLLSCPAVAVVGSRHCTAEGVRVAGDIARRLSHCGVTIASGMASGIDRVAHSAALGGAGRSIGVLGTGIDVSYPPKNTDLFCLMEEGGLLVSEFAPGTKAHADNFPIRNRIISGLSLGVLVVEAALRSGSLITARLALEQNREVYAIPGPTTADTSRGCQELVRQGARPVFHADDILRDLMETLRQHGHSLNTKPLEDETNLNTPQSLTQPVQIVEATTKQEAGTGQNAAASVLALLQAKGVSHVDAICTALGLPVFQVSALLTAMEVDGKVTRLPGARYEATASL